MNNMEQDPEKLPILEDMLDKAREMVEVLLRIEEMMVEISENLENWAKP